MKNKNNNSKKQINKSNNISMSKKFKSDCKINLNLQVLNEFKIDTNLKRIQKKLSLSKTQLAYYTRKFCESGHLRQFGRGWYEVTNLSSNLSSNVTKYGSIEEVRGHAYVWEINLDNIPKNWMNRTSILIKNNYDVILVGALKSTPRIKIMNRKVWLCNNKIRIFDIRKASYLGSTAKEARKKGLELAIKITKILENKFGFIIKPTQIKFQKEHYALINNELAKKYNEEGEKLSVKDEEGEWLLVDDSMKDGGELENVGKKAIDLSPKVQNWYNDHKKHQFEVTSSFILNQFNKNQTQSNELLSMFKAQLKINDLKEKQINYLTNEIIKLKDDRRTWVN